VWYSYTVQFWWKAMEGTSWDSINKGQMIAFSSFVPPRVLFALDFYGNGEKINYWLEAYDTCNLSLENLNNIDGGERFEPGNWYFVAVVVGSPVEGGRSLFVMSGFQPGTDTTTEADADTQTKTGTETREHRQALNEHTDLLSSAMCEDEAFCVCACVYVRARARESEEGIRTSERARERDTEKNHSLDTFPLTHTCTHTVCHTHTH
jgi:hypothetical protein